jgi:general secretion pathway protein G
MPSLSRSVHRRSSRRFSRRKSGFTLMEILIALAILGLLVGLGVAKFTGIFESSRIDAAGIMVNSSLKLPLETYQMRMGNYPSTAEGLQALITAPSGKEAKWQRYGPFLQENKIPVDPWGEPYQYEFPGKHNKDRYDVWSKGKDGQSGTADDVGNWDGTVSETKN